MNQKLLSPLIILAVFAADRISKHFVLKFIEFKSYDLNKFLSFNYVENTGVAFGMFSGGNSFFIMFTVILITGIMIVRRKLEKHGIYAVAGIALIIGGALGNLYDRIVHGFVIDFIDLSFFPAVFNVADSCISIGAFLLCLKCGVQKKEN